MKMDFDEVLTYPDLAKWCTENLPGSSAHLLDGEVIIHTGLTVEMNGELMALNDVEECEHADTRESTGYAYCLDCSESWPIVRRVYDLL